MDRDAACAAADLRGRSGGRGAVYWDMLRPTAPANSDMLSTVSFCQPSSRRQTAHPSPPGEVLLRQPGAQLGVSERQPELLAHLP